MELLFQPELTEYCEPGHPECPERLTAIVRFLESKGRDRFVSFEAVDEALLLDVHTAALAATVRENKFFIPDCPNIPGIFRYACLAAGGAVKAAELALEGKDACALVRPPGHHAGRNFLGGFCYLNNLAIAAAQVLKKKKRVAILDIDGHHGNGTEDIFRNEPRVLYASIHETGVFPFTGVENFANCCNFPLFSDTTSSRYLNTLERALSALADFSPDVLAVSLGFDTHAQDPLLHLGLRETDFFRMGGMIKKALPMPAFLVLEGGYNVEKIGSSFYCFLEGWERASSR